MTIFIAHFIAPAMEYRDYRGGERVYDTIEKEIEAKNEEEARGKAEATAEEIGEGWELEDVEETLDTGESIRELEKEAYARAEYENPDNFR